MKRREEKGKGKKEKYTYLNTEFQRIARRDRKAFLNEQCKEIEKNNRMGYADDTTLMAESEEELKNHLMKVKRKVKKLA